MNESDTSPSLVLQFRNPEIHRMLREVSETLGVSMSELAEVAIQQEFAGMEGNLDRKLAQPLNRLRMFPGEDPDRAAEDRREVTIEDPLRARQAN